MSWKLRQFLFSFFPSLIFCSVWIEFRGKVWSWLYAHRPNEMQRGLAALGGGDNWSYFESHRDRVESFLFSCSIPPSEYNTLAVEMWCAHNLRVRRPVICLFLNRKGPGSNCLFLLYEEQQGKERRKLGRKWRDELVGRRFLLVVTNETPLVLGSIFRMLCMSAETCKSPRWPVFSVHQPLEPRVFGEEEKQDIKEHTP